MAFGTHHQNIGQTYVFWVSQCRKWRADMKNDSSYELLCKTDSIPLNGLVYLSQLQNGLEDIVTSDQFHCLLEAPGIAQDVHHQGWLFLQEIAYDITVTHLQCFLISSCILVNIHVHLSKCLWVPSGASIWVRNAGCRESTVSSCAGASVSEFLSFSFGVSMCLRQARHLSLRMNSVVFCKRYIDE